MKIFAIGSSVTSSYWNGAATYDRGIYCELARLGYEVTAPNDIRGSLAISAIWTLMHPTDSQSSRSGFV